MTKNESSASYAAPMAHYHQVWSPKSHVIDTPVTHWTDHAWHWLRAHLPHMRVIGIGLAVFAVTFGITRGYHHFRESAAMQLLAAAAPNDAASLKSVLETVSQKYPRTASGKYAEWFLGTQYYQDGNFAEATRMYQQLAEHSAVHGLYYAVASEGEAYALERQGEYAKAVELFTRLAKRPDNPFADQDLLNAARNERLAGNRDKAEALLKSSKSPTAALQLLALEIGLHP